MNNDLTTNETWNEIEGFIKAVRVFSIGHQSKTDIELSIKGIECLQDKLRSFWAQQMEKLQWAMPEYSQDHIDEHFMEHFDEERIDTDEEHGEV